MTTVLPSLLLVIIPTIAAQTIEITPIYTDNGFALFKLNERQMVESFTKILHIVNLTEYHELMNLIEHNKNSLNLSIDDDNYKLLNAELSVLKHNYKTIIPQVYKNHRNKRALINLLGTGLKILAGTMNEDDATDIYEHLKNLDLNTKNAIGELNKQVVINNNLIKNMEDVNKHLNKQQQELNAFLTNITNRTNTIIKFYNKSKYVLQLYADITSVNKQIEKLTDIILLSRLNILAHDILTNEEIDKYNITIETMPYIQNSIMFNHELLIFAICLPKFANEKYYNAIVVPFPNNELEQLDSENVEVIISENFVYNNDENVILKKNLKLHNSYCIRNLLNKNNVCKFKFNNETSVEKINDDLIITKNLAVTKIYQTCTKQNLILKGNNLIKFNNCKITINDQSFINKINKYRSSVVIPTTYFNFTKQNNNLTLESLHLKTVTNRKQIEYIEYKNKSTNYFCIGFNLITLCIIVVLILLWKCKSRTKNITEIKFTEKTVNTPKKKRKHRGSICRDCKCLKGGGVTYANSHPKTYCGNHNRS